MSNYLAIATVTATLSYLFQDIRNEVPGTQISTSRPNEPADADLVNRLNIFLYQVTPNIGYSNVDLPSINSGGELVKSPLLALNLHYLLTAYGQGNEDIFSHQILAVAMRILNDNPILKRRTINDAIAANVNVIGLSDLADQVELVKINAQSLSLEDLTKLWGSLFHETNYRLSVAYHATVVLIEGKQQPKPSLPVRNRLVYVYPFKQPIINSVTPQMVEASSNTTLILNGRNLSADKTTIKFDTLLTPVVPANVSDNKISTRIPETLSSGIKRVQVIHPLMLGSPPAEHDGGFESNVAAFVLSPKIMNTQEPVIVGRGQNLSLTFLPPVSTRQRVEVLIGDRSFFVARNDLSGSPLPTRLTIKVPNDFLPNTYLLRIRVDGAESFLQTDESGKFSKPSVQVI